MAHDNLEQPRERRAYLEIARGLNKQALQDWQEGRAAEAEPLLRRALALRVKALGPAHPEIAQGLNDLAMCLESQGQYSAMEPLLKRPLPIYERVFAHGHPPTARGWKNFALP